METERKEVRIYNAALELPATERAAYLDQACAGDQALRRQVEALLHARMDADAFFKTAVDSQASSPRPATVVLPITEKAGDRIGRYKLLQKIGEGGCGVVYMAEQEEPVRRRVALKVIKLGMDTKSVVARFEAERQALAMMDHLNIARVLDAGATEAGRPYFVMELVKGVRITDYCDQNQLPTQARLDLFVQVCSAIQHAHQKGVIHRDIKPSNILVTLHDGVPVPKVIDFGIAKATEARLTDKTLFTAFEQFIGTPAYMSPEQAEMSGLDIDTRSDIYSLGVLLYELLTGKTPFDARELWDAGLDAMRRTIREKEPLRPSTRLETMLEGELTTAAKQRQSEPPKLVNLVRGDLDWIVMKALEKDRTRRYESASSFAQDVQRHLSNEPVAARPPSLVYKFQKAFRRNRRACAAAAAVFVALVLGLSLTTWQAIRAQHEKSRAEQAAMLAREESAAARVARQQAEGHRAEAERGRYIMTMNSVQQAWEGNNLALVNELLKDAGASPDRGFEWYYWQRETHRDLRTIRGPSNEVWSIAFAPDLRRVAIGCEDSSVRIWDAATGRELLTLRGHSNAVGYVAFSPDGRRVLTGSDDNLAKIWDTVDGREILTLRGHSNSVHFGTFSRDGRRILTCGADGTARLWDAATGQNTFTLRGRVGYDYYSAAFSPDGRQFVTCGNGGDDLVKLWNSNTGEELRTFRGHSNTVVSVAFSPDGHRMATGSADKSVIVWDATTGQQLFTLRGFSWSVTAIAFSPDGRRLATGSDDKSVKVWDAASAKELQTFRGHCEEVLQVAFFEDGRQLMTGSDDGMVKVWDVEEPRPWSILRGHSDDVTEVAFSPDGRRFVTGSEDSSAKVWDTLTGQELLILKGRFGAVFAVAFSPDGRRIATGTHDPWPKVWDASTGQELLTIHKNADSVHSIAFSPDGNRIVTSGKDGSARIWDAATGNELAALGGHSGDIRSVRFSPDGGRIATGGSDGVTRIWDASTAKKLLNIQLRNRQINALSFSPDGSRIATATGGSGLTASICEASTGRELLSLNWHASGVKSLAFSPDGRRIVTSSYDATARLWDATTGRQLLTLPRQTTGRINHIAFSPDGRRIISANGNGTVETWEAATVEQVRVWQEAERVASRH